MTSRPLRSCGLPAFLSALGALGWGCGPAPEVPALPSTSPGSVAQEGPAALGAGRSEGVPDTVVVSDGRGADGGLDPGLRPDPATWDTHSGVRAAASAARAHWTREEPGWEEEFRVMASVRGAFTRTGTDQEVVLYLMGLWPRCCPKMGLVVLEGDLPVRNFGFVGVAQTLRRIPDLDGDGLDEVVLEGSFGMGGQTSTSATILSFRPEGVVQRGPVAILESSCGTGRPDATSQASRVTGLPGPRIHLVHFVAPCNDGAAWTAQGATRIEPLEGHPWEGSVELAGSGPR